MKGVVKMIREVNLDMTKYRGMSSDPRPDGASNGSTFLEMDSGAEYMYDAENEQWRIMPSGSGGSGGDNTEVVSARAGADGTVYGSLKGRLDAENEDLNDKIDGEISLVKSHLEATQIVNEASGAVASFADGSDGVPVRGLMVQMEPIQDLHGYDSPWPAGGGKNLLNEVGYVSLIGCTYSDDIFTSNTMSNCNGAFVRLYLDSTTVNTQIKAATAGGRVSFTITADDTWNLMVIGYNMTATNIAAQYNKPATDGTYTISFTTDVIPSTSVYGKFSKIQCESGSSATAYAPYSNICPISGRQSVTVTRSGVNVWDEEWEVGGFMAADGTEYAWTDRIRSKNYIPVFENTTYCVTSNLYVFCYDTDKAFISPLKQLASGGTFTTPSGCRYIRFSTLSNTGATYNHDISINYPSTDHDYHPGTVASVAVQLGQTVYGGTVDVVSGEMVVDRAMVDLGTLNWTYFDSAQKFAARLDDGKYSGTGWSISDDCYCSLYPVLAYQRYATQPDKSVTVGSSFFSATSCALVVYDSAYTNTSTFKAAMDGVQLCYVLAQPVTITLTAEQLTTVLGTNNVWSDADSVSVDYVADTKLFIEQLTVPDADMVADANITSGSYFMVANNLFLATANIASGAAITPGVNCTRTSLAEALNALNA